MLPAQGFLAWLAAASLGAPVPSVPPPEPDHATRIEAVTRPRYDLQLAVGVSGRVARVLVEPGDAVKTGQEMIVLDDTANRIQLDLLKLRAESDLEILAAKGDWDMAKLQVQLTNESFTQYAASNIERERAILEAEKSRLAYELFKQRQVEAQALYQEARERITFLTLRTPRDGVVDRVAIEVGEFAEENKPILRVVDTSVLRIEAAVPTSRTLSIKTGDRVAIQYADEIEGSAARDAIQATVVSLAPVADASSETRIVRLDLLNPQGVPAGRTVWVSFGKPGASPTPSPPPQLGNTKLPPP